MKKTLIIVLFGIIFLVGCNYSNKNKDGSASTITIQEQGVEDTAKVEAIDDSGEALVEDTSKTVQIDTNTESPAVLSEDNDPDK